MAATVAFYATAAPAQVFIGGGPASSQLSDAVRVDEVDAAARTHLEQVQAFLAAEQWDEAVESLRQVMENFGDKVVKLSPNRFINARDYCHYQIGRLPAAALSLYRSRVDPQARAWYEEGVRTRSAARLRDVVDQHLASSWADDALFALGEMALAEGDPSAAYALWYRIIPDSQFPAPANPALVRVGGVPDTQLDLALVRSRLVLASILEGSLARAGRELALLKDAHPGARGRMGGREVDLAAALATLLEEATPQPASSNTGDWATFAGSKERNAVTPGRFDLVSKPLWEIKLAKNSADANVAQNYCFPPKRVAEDTRALLSYHPLVYRGVVYVNNEREISAYDLRTGQPPWGLKSPIIFTPSNASSGRAGRRMLGAPRFTMTASDGRLYAKMGSPVTSAVNEIPGAEKLGYLVCLDLNAQGLLLWEREPEDSTWAFEGAPLAAGNYVYVGLRRSGVQPQSYVACYDALTGRPVWRQFVCGADTPAHNSISEATHNLVTVHGQTVYYNTNLGAVAALDAASGRIKWVTLYPRAKVTLNSSGGFFYRDLNPAIYHQGKLFVAPADSESIYALDAETGQILWTTITQTPDAVHLLGAVGSHLIASGNKLQRISLEREGAVEAEDPQWSGLYGRGLLMGGQVVWATRDRVMVFDEATAGMREFLLNAEQASDGPTGGNLVATPEYLLIAGPDRLTTFAQFGGAPIQPGGGAAPTAPAAGP